MPPKSQTFQLSQLVKLQAIRLQIGRFEQSFKAIPEEIATIESNVHRYGEEIEQNKKLEQSINSQYRSYENEIQDRNNKLAQYQNQLWAVKTNIEYAALLKQIDTLKGMNEITNDQIFHLEEEKEQLLIHRVEKEKAFEEVKAANEKRVEELELKLKKAQKELDVLRQKEQRIAARIPQQLISRFKKIAEAREGIAVVSANGGICNGCFTSIRPQVYDKIRQGGTIVQCESCSRILFFDVSRESGQSS